MDRIGIHRNLNLLRSIPDKTIHRWTIKGLKSARTLGYKLYDLGQDDSLYLSAVEDVIQVGTLDRIVRQGQREIGAYLTGTISNPIQGKLIRVGLSPLGKNKNGLEEKCFVNADSPNREPVDFRDKAIKGMVFNSKGAFIIK